MHTDIDYAQWWKEEKARERKQRWNRRKDLAGKVGTVLLYILIVISVLIGFPVFFGEQ